MGRLPLGGLFVGIQGSAGGSCDPLNFYCTNYNRSYGQPKFVPGEARHARMLTPRTTGYQASLRPVVCYTPNVDRKDNPAMGMLLRHNYTSINIRDFPRPEHMDGTEPLPHSLSSQSISGFNRSCRVDIPKTRAVKSVHFDTRDHGSGVIAGIKPFHEPLLFMPRGKGTSEIENLRHGPAFMSTEYKTRFSKQPPQPTGFRTTDMGPIEDSGYTEGLTREPLHHDPPSQYRVPMGHHRHTGKSINKTDFLPSYIMQGQEPLQALSKNSERGSSFSREADQLLCTNDPNDFRPSSFMKPNDELLGKAFVSKKERSGYSKNTKKYVESEKEPPIYYLTNSQRYMDPAPHGKDREGWARFGIQNQHHTGFTVNNEPHIDLN